MIISFKNQFFNRFIIIILDLLFKIIKLTKIKIKKRILWVFLFYFFRAFFFFSFFSYNNKKVPKIIKKSQQFCKFINSINQRAIVCRMKINKQKKVLNVLMILWYATAIFYSYSSGRYIEQWSIPINMIHINKKIYST